MKDHAISMFVITALLCGTLILLISVNHPTGADTIQAATATFNVIGNVTEITITKTDNPDPVFSGNTLSYTITIENTGTATVYNITIDEIYPGNVIFNGSSPAPTSGDNIFFFANLTVGSSTTINITVNVSSNFTGILNNTVIANFTNQSSQNETPVNTSILTTVIAQPTPSPGGGGGGGAAQYAGCAPLKQLVRNGQSYYSCCTNADCQNFWRLPSNYGCVNTYAVLATTVCAPVTQLQMPAPSKGVCPTVRTCGSKCCNVGEGCSNGQCLLPAPVQLAPAPVQPEKFVIVGVSEKSLLWTLLLIVLAIIILFIIILVTSFKEEKKSRKKRKK